MKRAVVLAATSLLLAACGGARSPASPASASNALPARLSAVVQLAPPRTGYVHMELDARGDGVETFSCITSSVAADCRTRRRPQTLGATERGELSRLWAASLGSAPCSVAFPADAPTFRIEGDGHVVEGNLLPEQTHVARGYDPCYAGGRLAWWIVGVHDRPNP